MSNPCSITETTPSTPTPPRTFQLEVTEDQLVLILGVTSVLSQNAQKALGFTGGFTGNVFPATAMYKEGRFLTWEDTSLSSQIEIVSGALAKLKLNYNLCALLDKPEERRVKDRRTTRMSGPLMRRVCRDRRKQNSLRERGERRVESRRNIKTSTPTRMRRTGPDRRKKTHKYLSL